MENSETNLQFFHCPSCAGFGYEITAAHKHIQCHHCQDKPSMYGVLDHTLVYWDTPISDSGISQRHWHKRFNKAFTAILLLLSLSGILALIYELYIAFDVYGQLSYIFFEPTLLLSWFWFTVGVDAFIYYRRKRQESSEKKFTYKEKSPQEKQWTIPPHADFESLRKLQHKWGEHDYIINLADYYTEEAIDALDNAYKVAKQLKHHQITPLHLLAGLVQSNSIANIMGRLGVSGDALFKKVGKAMALEKGIQGGDGIDLGLEANHILLYAYEEAQMHKRRYIDVMELFVAVSKHDPWVQEIFYDLEIEAHTIANVVEWIHIQKELKRRYEIQRKNAGRKPEGVMDRAMTARQSKFLEALTEDYTGMARIGGFFPLIGREKEMDQILRIFREHTGNIMLVGPSGVGKTTLFQGLADLMAAEEVPPELQDKRLVILDPGNLVSDAEGIGVLEGRMTMLINEIASVGNVILGIEDIHHLLNMRSTQGSEDVAGILMNALSRGLIKVIATTTTEEYQDYIENRATFIRRFQVVKVDEMTHDEAILVLEAKTGSLEYKHNVFFSYDSIASLVDLSSKFIQDRYLPSKALDIMAETAAYVQGTKGNNSIITKEDVATVISEKTNVQITSITQDEREKLLNLEDIMHERVVGQDTAVTAVASAIRRAREGLRDTGRPIANLLFMGPTGVGKTEMAKTIAEVYFGNENNMIRVDMSEYQDVDALGKLIGSKGEKGYLTEQVRLKPFSLILLDELEKASKDVLNVFLQVMDDGRLTDGTGRTFDMSNTMIIATSNAGTQEIQNSFQAGLPVEVIKEQLMEGALMDTFSPEFLNRFDNVVVFKPLTFQEVYEIAVRMLRKLAQRMLNEKGIRMNITPEAVQEITQKGYHPLYGARPLRRVIQDTVDDALAKLLLAQRIDRRDTVVLKAGGQMDVKKAQKL